MLSGWIYRIFDIAVEEGYLKNDEYRYANALYSVNSIRNGIGVTLARNGLEYPYLYTHLIYWTVQTLLIIISVEAGVNMAIEWERRENGNEEYSFPSTSSETWPPQPIVWFRQTATIKVLVNLLLTLFLEGLLKFSDSIQHPLSEKSESFFPMDYYDTLISNNNGAFINAFRSFDNFAQPSSSSATTTSK